MKWLEHLKTINHHRRLVREHCFQVGLYWQGLTHDLSKYSPIEFRIGAKYFQGDRSPNDVERRERGYSSAWLHHKGRNKHHLEYWIDYSPNPPHEMQGMKMPVKYVVEMFCDRVAACKTYHKDKYTDKDAYAYYERSRGHYMMHPESEALLADMLKKLADQGEKAAFAYIRREILEKQK